MRRALAMWFARRGMIRCLSVRGRLTADWLTMAYFHIAGWILGDDPCGDVSVDNQKN